MGEIYEVRFRLIAFTVSLGPANRGLDLICCRQHACVRGLGAPVR